MVSVERIPASDWDTFVGASEASSVFHTSVWRKVLTKQGLEPLYLGAIDNAGTIKSVYPFFVTKVASGLANVLVSIPQSDIGGPVFADGANRREILSSFSDYLRRMRFRKRIVMVITNGIEDATYSLILGRTDITCTGGFFKLDLIKNPPERIWSEVFSGRGHQRTEIRNLEKSNCFSYLISEEKEFLSFMNLHNETVLKAGGEGHDAGFLTTIWALMFPENFNVLAVRLDDKIVGGLGFFCLPRQRQIHIMYGAYDSSLPPRYGGVYLFAFWRLLVWAHEHRYSKVNFSTTPVADSHPLHRFKKQFGGEFVKRYQVKNTTFGITRLPLIRTLTRTLLP
jgi:hypothetical protein